MLCGRLFYLQVIEAENIAAEIQSVRKRIVHLDARRGDIVDRNGNLLAGTRSLIQLGADPKMVDLEETRAIALLAGILDVSYPDLFVKLGQKERIGSDGKTREVRWIPLADIDEDLYAAINELEVSGVYGNRRYERYYPGKQLASHLVGFINKEQIPVMGVEQAVDYYLRGQPGWRETEVDGLRRELAAYREREVPPRNGLHVQLTIDQFIQSIVESAIEELVETSHPKGVSIIVSNPATGDVLALANYPTFDPNTFWDFPIENQRNRALSDQYEPGSTYKIVPIAAALEEGLINPETQIDCSVERKVFNGVNIPMPADHRNLGIVPVRTVVTKSSNRGAAQIGMLLGEERLYEYSSKFGFGKLVDWPLSGVAKGSLMTVDRWDGYTISRLPTGYAIGATPMQVHLAMSTIANDGVRVSPRLLAKVINADSGTEISLGPDKHTRVLTVKTSRLMKEMLLSVVSPEGTAVRAELPGYEVAGKTGTARKIIDGHYSHRNHFGSFSGFFPASKPEVVITVVVDDADIPGPAYGGIVAAPIFKSIGEKLIPHMAIRKPQEWDPFIVSND